MTDYLPSASSRQRVTFAESQKFSFCTTWFDKVADQDRKYIVNIFVDTKEIEIMDVGRKQAFLKRCPYPELDMTKFYLGNSVVIHGRQHNIVEFANEYTKKALSSAQERTCAIVKPHAYGANPNIFKDLLRELHKNQLAVSRLQLSQLTPQDAAQFYAEHVSKPFYPSLQQMITSGPALIIELVGDQAVQKWRNIIGPTDPRQALPQHLRSKYGISVTENAFHGSATPQEAEREIQIAFQLRPLCAPEHSRTAVIVIEPTFKAQYGDILSHLFTQINQVSGLVVSGIHSADPVAADIDELFKAYQGVIPNWRSYCDAFDDGVCIAIELTGSNDVIQNARNIVGPFDPEIAKLLKPQSVRAVFGKDCVQNAVFVTDIAEEAEIHSDFWFRCAE
ncbi:Nucleoside_diphosphate kinase [Hexamita inflata]|uniref:Nucleoside diphosphate kinase n=1 Tax=Hexamita inflata TaxID=28002 RepID=A0AA86PNN4_9EUKA|nr:Nucleoside diphosphate kinase [Hexamita inflata]